MQPNINKIQIWKVGDGWCVWRPKLYRGRPLPWVWGNFYWSSYEAALRFACLSLHYITRVKPRRLP